MLTRIPAVLVLTASLLSAAPLPKPQHMETKEGRLSLEKGIAIRFASAPAEEDRFVERELALGLEKAGVRRAEGGPAITLKRTGAVDALPGRDERGGEDGREAYALEVTPAGAEIRARSSTGLFYGAQTLLQLLEGKALPAVAIRDWPALPYRGFMMDLSHGSLLTEAEIKRQIDFLARWKANQYYFYSEANIELAGYELINPNSRYTAAQIARIVAYARERHVDVVPCMEFFAHTHDILKLERYGDLAPLRYGGEFRVRDERVQRLLSDWVAQIAPMFPSPWMHVGFDEPWTLQRYGTKIAGEKDAAKLFLEHLRFVSGLLEKQNKRMVLWADIQSGSRLFESSQKFLAQLPPGTVAVPWDYDARPDFTPQVKPLRESGVPVVVAPGITMWNEVAPDFDVTFKNIDGFAAAAKQNGAFGLLNTGWTDDAQVLYRMARPGMAYGAAASWQSEPLDRERFFEQYAALTYSPDAAADCAAALASMTRAQTLYRSVLGGATMHRFWEDSLAPERLKKAREGKEQLRQARLESENAEERIRRVLRAYPEAEGLKAMLVGSRMLNYLGAKHLYALEMQDYFAEAAKEPTGEVLYILLEAGIQAQDHGLVTDLLDSMSEMKDEYRAAWMDEWTTFRLNAALARWDGEFQYWRRVQARLARLLDSHQDKAPLPPLDSLRDPER